jgi:hypothetical protein
MSSKEQTPITAEEIRIAIESGNIEKVLTIMELYSQANVLEALEERDSLINKHCCCKIIGENLLKQK